jgi:hypothetical protein
MPHDLICGVMILLVLTLLLTFSLPPINLRLRRCLSKHVTVPNATSQTKGITRRVEWKVIACSRFN